MNIVVCLKQVPDTGLIKINPETGTLMRSGVPSIMNPFDKCALETALELKDLNGGKVTVLSMGLPQATDIIKDALAMGADEGILVSDPALAGSDTFATSTALAAAIRHSGEFDLVLCGQEALDGQTAQVGAEISELLGIPQITRSLKVKVEEGKVYVSRDTETSRQVVEASLPALVTVCRSEKEPRFASIKGKMKARKAVIPTWNADEIGVDKAYIGLMASPTRVIKIFTPPVPDVKPEIFQEEDEQVAVEKLVGALVGAKIIGE